MIRKWALLFTALAVSVSTAQAQDADKVVIKKHAPVKKKVVIHKHVPAGKKVIIKKKEEG